MAFAIPRFEGTFVAMISAPDALRRLREGNGRFVQGVRHLDALLRRTDLLDGQNPFAVILGCSDSRVPVEIIFDQGLGDLFVIRVAGNIVAPSQIGSVEFAAEQFGTRLVVILGHTRCGAVRATLDQLQRPSANQSHNLRSIVDRIRPAVAGLLETDLRHDPEALACHAVRANVRVAADHLRHGSQILEHLIQNDGLLIVGAEYSLETGAVDFFEGVP
jgi:carbonic anhydrase